MVYGSHPGSGKGNHDQYPDDVLLVKDGVPHYTGKKIELLKEYRRRVEILVTKAEGLENPGKRVRCKAQLGLRLLEGLHGKAWKAVEGIFVEAWR